jgi:hypothetical protein
MIPLDVVLVRPPVLVGNKKGEHMTRTADRKHRQPQDNIFAIILLERFAQVASSEALRARLLELELEDELPEAIALVVRACCEIFDSQLDDAEALLEAAVSCAQRNQEKAFVLQAQALLAMQRGEERQALRLALRGLWLHSDPRLWSLFLVIAYAAGRSDIVDATLQRLAAAGFLGSAELRETLAADPLLSGVRSRDAFKTEIAPWLLPREDN